jgi:hypothetical protein
MANQYLGETDHKRIVRYQAMRRAQELWKITGVPKGWAITLAGPKAGDIGCLRDMLGFSAAQTLFVDYKSLLGLQRAQQKWKGVSTYYGDVADAVDLFHPIALLNLDFCGRLNSDVMRIAKRAAPYLSPGAMVFYTFFRGREYDGRGLWDELSTIPTVRTIHSVGGYRELQRQRQLFLDEKRVVGYCLKLQAYLGGELEPVFLLRYDSRQEDASARHSPMGVLGFQKVPRGMLTPAWRKAVANAMSEGSVGGILTVKDVWDKVRHAAIVLRNEGREASEIASILNVTIGTVSAWFAHDTRGTYNQKSRYRRKTPKYRRSYN